VAFISWIREEQVFASVVALVSKMQEDARVAQSVLARTAETFFPEP
jgi:FAD synthase